LISIGGNASAKNKERNKELKFFIEKLSPESKFLVDPTKKDLDDILEGI
jgi:hypothetical protein